MIPKSEQEMHICAMRSEAQAYLYCSDVTWITKMDKLVANNPSLFTVHSEDTYGKTYKFPKRLITIRSKIREVPPEQADRMRSSNVEDEDDA